MCGPPGAPPPRDLTWWSKGTSRRRSQGRTSSGRTPLFADLKRVEESVGVALEAALQQISSREYALGLWDVADPVVEIAIVFEGKKPYVRMRRGGTGS